MTRTSSFEVSIKTYIDCILYIGCVCQLDIKENDDDDDDDDELSLYLADADPTLKLSYSA